MAHFDQVRQQFQVEADGSLAHSVQQEEYDDKKNFNISTRRTVRGDIQVAKKVQNSLQRRKDNDGVEYYEHAPSVLELSNLNSEAYSTAELCEFLRKSRYQDSDESDDENEDFEGIALEEEAIYQTKLPEPYKKAETVEKVAPVYSHPKKTSKYSKPEEYDFASLQRLIRGSEPKPEPNYTHVRDSVLARQLQDEELAKLLQDEEDRKARQMSIKKTDEEMARALEQSINTSSADTSQSRNTKKNVSFGNGSSPHDSGIFENSGSNAGSHETSSRSGSNSERTHRTRKTKRTCVLVYKGMSGEEAVKRYLEDVERKNSLTGVSVPVEYTQVKVKEISPGEKPGGKSRVIYQGGGSSKNSAGAKSMPPPRPEVPPKIKTSPKNSVSESDGHAKKTGQTLWYGGYADEGNYSWDKKSVSVNNSSLNGKRGSNK